MSYVFIEAQAELDIAVAEIACSPVIGLDTEFIRTQTYFPILSLIQISTESGRSFVFDMLCQDKLDRSGLLSILVNRSILKIVHSAEQDLEAIFYRFNIKITNIIDTQIMADMLEIGKQVGYGMLVERYFGIKINKERQFSAWHKRPLSHKQLEYAALDTFYLIGIFKEMSQEMKRKNIDMELLTAKSRAISHKTKHINRHSIEKLTISFCSRNNITLTQDRQLAEKLIDFREKLAIKHNRTRKHIMDDNIILELIAGKPITDIALGKYVKPHEVHKAISKDPNEA